MYNVVDMLRRHRHIIFITGNRRMIIQPLRHQLQRERVLLAGGLLDFGPFVLEPDFDLGLVQTELGAQLLPPPFG